MSWVVCVWDLGMRGGVHAGGAVGEARKSVWVKQRG